MFVLQAFLPQPKYSETCTQEPAYLPLSLSLCGPLGSLSLRLLDLSLDCSCDGLERSCRPLLIHKVAANRCCDTVVLVGKLCSGAETFSDLLVPQFTFRSCEHRPPSEGKPDERLYDKPYWFLKVKKPTPSLNLLVTLLNMTVTEIVFVKYTVPVEKH